MSLDGADGVSGGAILKSTMSVPVPGSVFVSNTSKREGGEWRYDEGAMRKSMPQFDGVEASRSEPFEPWQIYDMNRYYFFQGLSASGALLLLAQFGPGELAVEVRLKRIKSAAPSAERWRSGGSPMRTTGRSAVWVRWSRPTRSCSGRSLQSPVPRATI